MKNLLLSIIVVVACLFSSCRTYRPAMSEPENTPINQKLPRMEIRYAPGGNFSTMNASVTKDFVFDIINREIKQNIITTTGEEQGSIEVYLDNVSLRENLVFPFLSGLSLFSLNLLAMPITVEKSDLTVTFTIFNSEGVAIDTYKYSADKKTPVALYYGKTAKVCMAEATKELMEEFRNDLNSKSTNLIDKLEPKKPAENNLVQQDVEIGSTASEAATIRWDVRSRPQDADIFCRVVSKTPEVKSTRNKYMASTPYTETKALGIKGLTYRNSDKVRIILRCEKEGYMPQEKEFDARMVLDEEELSAFFRLVKEEEY